MSGECKHKNIKNGLEACPDCHVMWHDMTQDEKDMVFSMWYDDTTQIDPTNKRSQQPHDDKTMYCNACEMYVKPTSFGGEKDLCPYHQRSYQSEEGIVMMYDEFNQDGEEW